MDYQKTIEESIQKFLGNREIKMVDLSVKWLNEEEEELTSLVTWVPFKEIPEENWVTIEEAEEPSLVKVEFIIKKTVDIEEQVSNLIELMNRVRFMGFPELCDWGHDPVWMENIDYNNKFSMTSCWHYTELSWWQFGDPFKGYRVKMIIGMCYCS